MDFDDIADNEDQLYRDLLEKEQNEKNTDKKTKPKPNNNYDDESWDEY